MKTMFQTILTFLIQHKWLVGAGLALLLVLLVVWLRVRAKAKKKPDAPAAGAADQKKEAEPAKLNRDLQQSFTWARRILKRYFPGRQSAYAVPWFLLAGEENSGKTSLLEESKLIHPLNDSDHAKGLKLGGCRWRFFEKGALLDLDGRLILNEEGESSDDLGWATFLRLLVRHRGQRGLDGVILTVPVTDLLEAEDNPDAPLVGKAEAIFQKLVLLQRKLGLSFPVYVVVTQCDLAPDFQEYCAELPASARNQIFGWSSTYQLDRGYQESWLKEAFETLGGRLLELQLEAAYDGFQTEARDGFFRFPTVMASMSRRLNLFLSGIFVQSTYHDPMYLRGIYFTGRTGAIASTPSDKDPESAQMVRPLTAVSGESQSIGFLDDLLEHKIFPEFKLARPNRQKKTLQERQVWILRAAILILFGWLVYGILRDSGPLSRRTATMTNHMNGIQRALGHKSKNTLKLEWFHRHDNPLFAAMTTMESDRLFSRFFPPTWFSALEPRLRRAIDIGFEKILLASLGDELEHKIETLTEWTPPQNLLPDPLPRQPVIFDQSVSFKEFSDQKIMELAQKAQLPFSVHDRATPPPASFDQLDSFTVFTDYIQALEKLEYFIGSYNAMDDTPDRDRLRELIEYCFGFDVPEATLSRIEAYAAQLSRLNEIKFDRQDMATKKGLLLYLRFLDDLFRPAQILWEDQVYYQSQINQPPGQGLDRGPVTVVDLLRRISFRIEETQRFYSGEPLGILRGEDFVFGDPYDQLLGHIKSAQYVGNGLQPAMLRAFQAKYVHYKNELDPGFLAQAISMKEPIRAFFNLPYLDPAFSRTAPPYHRPDFQSWQKLDLARAFSFYEDYASYKAAYLEPLPVRTWGAELLQQIALEFLAGGMNHMIERIPLPFEPVPGQAMERLLGLRVAGFFSANTSARGIMAIFEELKLHPSRIRLNELMDAEALNLLTQADRLLEEDVFYRLDVSTWDGRQPVLNAILGMGDTLAIKVYLESNRHGIEQFTHRFAKPLIEILQTSPALGDMESMGPVRRWTELVRDLENYNDQAPYPPLRRLERFFLSEANLINLDNFRTLAQVTGESRNFFIRRENRIKTQIYKRCEALLVADAIARFEREKRLFYDRVLEYFESGLADRFPFAESHARGADPQAVREFMRRFKQFGPEFKDLVRQLPDSIKGVKDARAFLDALTRTLEFLEPVCGVDANDLGPGFNLSIALRPRPDLEIKGNQIIHREMRVGHPPMTLIQDRGRWRYGDEVHIQLRWAKDSPDQPRAGSISGPLRLDGSTVTYAYEDPWSLLRMIAAHRVSRPVAGAHHNLRFEVPLDAQTGGTASGKTEPARGVVYLWMGLAVPGQRVALVVPEIPYVVPSSLRPADLPAWPNRLRKSQGGQR